MPNTPAYYPPAAAPDTYVGDLLIAASEHLRSSRIQTGSKLNAADYADICFHVGTTLNELAQAKVNAAAYDKHADWLKEQVQQGKGF